MKLLLQLCLFLSFGLGLVTAVNPVVTAAGLEAANKGLALGLKELDKLSTSHYENAGLICWWNEWQSRDQRARIEKTFNNGRFSRVRRTIFGIPNGRWYCCMTQAALLSKGQKLDS